MQEAQIKPKHPIWDVVWLELALIAGFLTSIVFLISGDIFLNDANRSGLRDVLVFLWLFSVMAWASFGVVRHADHLAEELGEPYGTLILTLAVISLEVVLVSAVMLTGFKNPTLGRDMMFSVLMIVLNGMVGVSLLLGGYRHVEQHFNLQGANSFLAVLVPLSVLSLVLPDYTQSTVDPSLSTPQAEFLIVASLCLYFVFLGIQTLRHREYFTPPSVQGIPAEMGEMSPKQIPVHAIPYHSFFVLAYMLPIVFLSKKLAVLVDYGIANLGAPVALGGLLVAVLVLAPEALAAFHAALEDQLQRSINICLGSALATIGLTVPAVLCIGFLTGESIILGLDPVPRLLLLLTLFLSFITFSSGRSNVLQGVIHLILFLAYIVLLFD